MKKNVLLLLIIVNFIFNNCSINKMIVNRLADSLASGESTVFTGEDDPQLVEDALPFALKLYESLLEMNPEHTELLLATGKAFCLYAYAFIQFKAQQLPDEEIDKKKEMTFRAKKLFLRGRGYVLRAIEVEHPGFLKKLEQNEMESALSSVEKEDVPYLFWAGMAWMGAFAIDPFDFELSITKSRAVSMISKALELNESFENGAIHNFFISYYGSMPVDMGGSEEKARKHFKRSVELSKGLTASPYVSLATSVCVKNQNVEEYKELLNKTLAIDVDKDLKNRLANILDRKKAQWLLKHIDNYFLLDEGETE